MRRGGGRGEVENRGEGEKRKGNGRMESGTERETTEGQRRGEKRGEGGHPSLWKSLPMARVSWS